MRLDEVLSLSEGVVIHDGHHLFAYAITLAEAYDAAPVSQPAFVEAWKALVKHNADVMFSRLKGSGITVEFRADDPYDDEGGGDPSLSVRYMLWDMIVNKRLKIYTGFSDNHPVFSAVENVVFRTVHDYYTHGKLRAAFAAEIKRRGLDQQQPTPEELRQILPTIRLDRSGNIGHQFTYRGELNAFVTHARLAPKVAVPALFTEVAGQASYNCVVGNFPTQKASIIPGFDYERVGVVTGDRARRMGELVDQLKSGAASVQSSILAAPEINIAEMRKRMG